MEMCRCLYPPDKHISIKNWNLYGFFFLLFSVYHLKVDKKYAFD